MADKSLTIIDQAQLEKIRSFVQERMVNIRGVDALMRTDLAELYEVDANLITKAIQNNTNGQGKDLTDLYVFKLDSKEKTEVANKIRHLEKLKFSPYEEYAFTLYGIIAFSGILRSGKANIMFKYVVNEFIEYQNRKSEIDQISQNVAKIMKDEFVSKSDFKELSNQILGFIDHIENKLKNQNNEKQIGFQGNWNKK